MAECTLPAGRAASSQACSHHCAYGGARGTKGGGRREEQGEWRWAAGGGRRANACLVATAGFGGGGLPGAGRSSLEADCAAGDGASEVALGTSRLGCNLHAPIPTAFRAAGPAADGGTPSKHTRAHIRWLRKHCAGFRQPGQSQRTAPQQRWVWHWIQGSTAKGGGGQGQWEA